MMRSTSLGSSPSNGVTSAVRWIDRIITACAIVIAVSSLVVLFMSLMAEVVVRYITNQGMGWPTEVPNLLFPWMVMAGIVLAAQRGQHIAVNNLLAFLKTPAIRALLIALNLLAALTFFYLSWVGMDVIEITGSEVYPVTGITAQWAYMSLIAGFVGLGLTALTTVVLLFVSPEPESIREHRLEDQV